MKILDTSLIGAILLSAINMSEFSYNEFVYSDTAKRYDIQNVPSAEQIENGKALYKNILAPIRDRFGEVKITSAYRNPKLNALVGGVGNSQHMEGKAVDFIVPDWSRYDIAKWIIENLEYDQLIIEPTWIHVSYSRTKNRNENLIYENGNIIPYIYK